MLTLNLQPWPNGKASLSGICCLAKIVGSSKSQQTNSIDSIINLYQVPSVSDEKAFFFWISDTLNESTASFCRHVAFHTETNPLQQEVSATQGLGELGMVEMRGSSIHESPARYVLLISS